MSRLDKQRRKELLQEFKRNEMAAAFAALPATNPELHALFDGLGARLPVEGCDHTRRLTLEHIRNHKLPEAEILQWLDDNGGFCDCEVLNNSAQAWLACKDFETDS